MLFWRITFMQRVLKLFVKLKGLEFTTGIRKWWQTHKCELTWPPGSCGRCSTPAGRTAVGSPSDPEYSTTPMEWIDTRHKNSSKKFKDLQDGSKMKRGI